MRLKQSHPSSPARAGFETLQRRSLWARRWPLEQSRPTRERPGYPARKTRCRQRWRRRLRIRRCSLRCLLAGRLVRRFQPRHRTIARADRTPLPRPRRGRTEPWVMEERAVETQGRLTRVCGRMLAANRFTQRLTQGLVGSQNPRSSRNMVAQQHVEHVPDYSLRQRQMPESRLESALCLDHQGRHGCYSQSTTPCSRSLGGAEKGLRDGGVA